MQVQGIVSRCIAEDEIGMAIIIHIAPSQAGGVFSRQIQPPPGLPAILSIIIDKNLVWLVTVSQDEIQLLIMVDIRQLKRECGEICEKIVLLIFKFLVE